MGRGGMERLYEDGRRSGHRTAAAPTARIVLEALPAVAGRPRGGPDRRGMGVAATVGGQAAAVAAGPVGAARIGAYRANDAASGRRARRLPHAGLQRRAPLSARALRPARAAADHRGIPGVQRTEAGGAAASPLARPLRALRPGQVRPRRHFGRGLPPRRRTRLYLRATDRYTRTFYPN